MASTKRKYYDYIPKLVISSLFFLILSIVCFYVGCTNILGDFFKNESSISIGKNIATNVGSIFLVSGIYNVIYEYSIKNSMFNVIRKELGIKDFIVSSGVDSIWMQLDDIPYAKLFEETKLSIDILHSYGNSWNQSNIDYIKDLLRTKKNITIRVILLSPKSDLNNGLYRLYRKDSIFELYNSMYKSVKEWIDLSDFAKENGNVIKIFYHDQNPTHSIYRFDDKIVNIANSIPTIKTNKLPTIICKKNEKYQESLFNMYNDEIECVIKDHTEEVSKENFKSFFPEEFFERKRQSQRI